MFFRVFSCFFDVFLIKFIEKCERGVQILKDYGASEFLCEYKQRLSLKKSQKNIEIIDLLLYNMVNFAKEDPKSEEKPEKSMNFCENPEKHENRENIEENREIREKIVKKPKKTLFSLNFIEKDAKKQEFLFLLPVFLSATDEKVLFDLAVKMKFAEKNLINELLTQEIPAVLRDFPVEIFRNQPEILQELMKMLKNRDFCEKALKNLLFFMKKVKKAIKFTKSSDFQRFPEKSIFSEKNEIFAENRGFSNSATSMDLSQFSFTFCDFVKNIMISTFEILENREFSFEIAEIWLVFIEILKEIKGFFEIFLDLVVFFLNICNKIAEKLEISLYEDLEFQHFLIFYQELFCLVKPEEIQEDFMEICEKAYGFLYNGCLKCLFPEKKAEKVMIYAYLFKESGNIEKV